MAFALLAACGGGESDTARELGGVIGRVELSDGNVASLACTVRVLGMPRGALCDAKGHFEINDLPPGHWQLEIKPNGELANQPGRRISIGVNARFLSDTGLITLFGPGAIGGRLIGGTASGLEEAVVALPGFGVFTGPTPQNAYLLTNVPPGSHDVVLILRDSSLVKAGIEVVQRKTTTGINFIVAEGLSGPGTINGVAYREDGVTDGIEVTLVDSLDGETIAVTTPGEGGAFSFDVGPGVYLVRATEDGNPAQARAPNIYLASETEFKIPYALVLPLAEEDCDGDGLVGDADNDDDNDGVLNEDDAFRCDPTASSDADGDGVPDDEDLRNDNDPIDFNPTPNSDGDSHLDFEDNCDFTDNEDQLDSDGDAFGDACDVCPSVANPQQDPGACISAAPECDVDAHCNGRVCTDGVCQDCTGDSDCEAPATCTDSGTCELACEENTDCSEGLVCDTPNAVCVQCLEEADCGGGGTCKTGANTCVECLTTADCPGSTVCDQTANTCVECLITPDCPVGVCKVSEQRCVQCLSDGDCVTGTCNLMTNTCSGACTDDSDCDSQYCKDPGPAGECVDCINNAHCDDSLFCNGTEHCDINECASGTPPSIDDGIDCTADSCDEVNDTVVHTPSDAACADDDDCTGDICNPGTGCEHHARLLVFNGTGQSSSPLTTLASTLPGYSVQVTTDATEFQTAYDTFVWDVLLIDAPPLQFSPGMQSRVSDWIGQGKPLVIHAPDGLFDSQFRQDLGVTSFSTAPMPLPSIVESGSAGATFYGYVEDLPSPFGASLSSFITNGVNVAADERLASFPSNEGAIVTSNNRRFIINGFSGGAFLFENTDDDTDGKLDIVELYTNEVTYVCKPPPAEPEDLHRRIASGFGHVCAITSTGDVRCWGSGGQGVLGLGNGTSAIGDDEFPAVSLDVNVGGKAKSIAAGDSHTCALLTDNSVRCWGDNFYGQLGLPGVAKVGESDQPADHPPVQIGGPVKQLVAGGNHTCALLFDGTVRCWGYNNSGQLGLGHTNTIGDDEHPDSQSFVYLGPAVPAVEIAAGGQHNCAITDSNQLFCWGEGDQGQLGTGSAEDVGDDEAASSGEVTLPGIPSRLGLGPQHSCAILAGGDVVCWGNNNRKLGQGTTDNIGDDELLTGLSPVSLPGTASQIGGGTAHTCALRVDGTVKCWGQNNAGALGLGDIAGPIDPPAPAPIVELADTAIEITVSDYHSCALLTGDRVQCWGDNNFGQLGYGHTSTVGDDETPADEGTVRWLPQDASLQNRLAVGTRHTCAIAPGGKLRCWGQNDDGQLGLPGVVSIGTQFYAAAADFVDLSEDVAAVDAGDGFTCVVTASRQVRCFGRNNHGQLGLGHHATIGDDEHPSSVPALLENIVEVAAGKDHVCARSALGDVRCWGFGGNGRLGAGDELEQPDAALAPVVPLGGAALQITAGEAHTCALLEGGSIRCWGAGTNGQLGNGSLNNVGQGNPINTQSVVLGGNARSISAGRDHTCALLTSNAVRCWGTTNEVGQLGQGQATGTGETPAILGDVPLPGSSADAVWAGGDQTCVRVVGVGLVCFGGAAKGQLGYGESTNRGDDESAATLPPVPVGGNVVAASLGPSHTCAFLENGTLHCWGDGSDGALGRGNAVNLGDFFEAREGGPVPWLAAVDSRMSSHSGITVLNHLDTTLHGWGNNNAGGLGLGHTNPIGDDETPASTGGIPFPYVPTDVAAGGGHACTLYMRTPYCWGYNMSGQLGLGHTDSIGDDETLASLPSTDVGGFVRHVYGGDDSTCALLHGGHVRCWGGSAAVNGQSIPALILGDDESPQVFPPIDFGGPVASMSLGARSACAVRESGELYCWGENTLGQLGYGHSSNVGDEETPVQEGPLSISKTVQQVSVGLHSACALTNGGRVFCWGSNVSGELGYGHTSFIGDDEAPDDGGYVDLPELVAAVYVGTGHTCVITVTGGVICWGAGGAPLGRQTNSAIGDDETPNDGANSYVSLPERAVELSMGHYHTCALLASREVYCWGLSPQGELGYGNLDTIGDDEPADSGGPVSF